MPVWALWYARRLFWNSTQSVLSLAYKISFYHCIIFNNFVIYIHKRLSRGWEDKEYLIKIILKEMGLYRKCFCIRNFTCSVCSYNTTICAAIRTVVQAGWFDAAKGLFWESILSNPNLCRPMMKLDTTLYELALILGGQKGKMWIASKMIKQSFKFHMHNRWNEFILKLYWPDFLKSFHDFALLQYP